MKLRDHYISHHPADLLLGFMQVELALALAYATWNEVFPANGAGSYVAAWCFAHGAILCGVGAYTMLFRGYESRKRAEAAAKAMQAGQGA